MSDAKVNEQLRKAAERYSGINEDLQRFAISEIDRTRLELNDLLAEYAKKDNTISRARVNSLLRSLDEIEESIRNRGEKALNSVVKDSADFGVERGAGALASGLGEAAVGGIATDKISRSSLKYVVNRYGDDGLVLSDRVWNLAGEQRDELNKVIRSGIIRGESVNQLTAQVRKVYDNETWKIRRLVQTEGNTAYRVGTSYVAQESDRVAGLRVNDRPGHNNHTKHRCYELANQDPYGLGEGVYKPDDSRIYQIHPNCTAYLTYVLKDDPEGGDGRNVNR